MQTDTNAGIRWRVWCVWGLMALAGCEPVHSGVIVGAKPPPLLHFREFSPRVFVETAEGKQIRLDKLGGPFYVVGFVAPPGEEAEYLSPVLIRLSNELWLDSIEVIQITLPTPACSLPSADRPTDSATDGLAATKNNFARFYDPEKIAWHAFWRPAPGTLLLVDRRNLIPMIDKRSTLDNPQPILRRAYDLQRDWEQTLREDQGS